MPRILNTASNLQEFICLGGGNLGDARQADAESGGQESLCQASQEVVETIIIMKSSIISEE